MKLTHEHDTTDAISCENRGTRYELLIHEPQPLSTLTSFITGVTSTFRHILFEFLFFNYCIYVMNPCTLFLYGDVIAILLAVEGNGFIAQTQ